MASNNIREIFRNLILDSEPNPEFVPKQASPIPDSAGQGSNPSLKGGQSAGGNILAGGNVSAGNTMTETRFADRTYHPRQTLKSTDGIITWLFDPIKSVQLADSAGNSVTLIFDKPTL